jgi:hypothetical protein
MPEMVDADCYVPGQPQWLFGLCCSSCRAKSPSLHTLGATKQKLALMMAVLALFCSYDVSSLG